MKNRILSLFLTFFFTTTLIAQDWSNAKEPESITSVNDAAKMAEEILKAAGKKANFKIAEAEVPNAMAVVHMGKRYILYNPRFINNLTRATGTKWAAVSVLAHEIGHHLYSSSENKGKTPLATELEADEFSGFVLQKMGASLHDAQVAMKILGSKYATRTHPGRDDRVSSIADGWKNAGGVLSEEEEDAIAMQEVEEERQNTETRNTTNATFTIAAKVLFDANPNTDYYVTKKLNLVKVENEQVFLIGRVTRSSDSNYPYMIYDDSGYRIYVAADGDIVNKSGKVIGRMKAA